MREGALTDAPLLCSILLVAASLGRVTSRVILGTLDTLRTRHSLIAQVALVTGVTTLALGLTITAGAGVEGPDPLDLLLISLTGGQIPVELHRYLGCLLLGLLTFIAHLQESLAQALVRTFHRRFG